MSRRADFRRPDRSGGGDVASIAAQVSAFSAGRPQFFAEKYNLDGGSGKVGSFFDGNDPTHLLVQTVALNQVVVPVGHADYGGALCATATGNEAYQSNRSTTYWGICSDGVSVEMVRVFTPLVGAATRVIDATAFAGSNKGHQAFWASGGNASVTLIATAGLPVNGASAGPTGQDVPTYIWNRFEQAGANQYEVRRKSALISSGAYATAPSAGASQAPLTLFSNGYPAVVLGATCRWVYTGVFPALSAAQRAVVNSWIQQRWGIAP